MHLLFPEGFLQAPEHSGSQSKEPRTTRRGALCNMYQMRQKV